MDIEKSNYPVAGNIASIIRKKGLKRYFVAQQLGCSGQQLSYMLNGRRLIRPCDILAFSKILNVSVEQLYKIDI